MNNYGDLPNTVQQYLGLIAAYPELVSTEDVPLKVQAGLDEILSALEELEDDGLSDVGVVYEDQYIVLLRDVIRRDDGQAGTYIRVVTKPIDRFGVVALPLTDNGDVVLLNHYRHATQSWHLEAPRGFGVPGASPEEAIKKELAEEIGATNTIVDFIGDIHLDSGLLGGQMKAYLAKISEYQLVVSDEAIASVKAFKPSEVFDLIGRGEITDAPTICALAVARSRGLLL